MKTRLFFVALMLALVASLAACGGGGTVPASAIAIVDGQQIPLTQFNSLLQQALKQSASNGQPPPTPGSPQYAQIRNQVVAYLVQVTELEQQAKKEGVSVTPQDVDKYFANLAKTKFQGSMTKLVQALKLQGLTVEEAKQQLYVNLLAQKLHDKVSKAATVTDAQAQQYYHVNLSQYSVPAATTRNVQYILFKCAEAPSTTCPAAKSRAEKKIADTVEQKLKNGATFEAMAKQYSDDPTTASKGGHLCISKSGQSGSCIPTIPAFSDAGFALKTGAITQQPIDATSPANQGYGWFIVKAAGAVKNTKAHTTPFSKVEASIKSTLLQQSQETLWQAWLSDLAKKYEGKVSYQTGYAPPTTTAIPTSPPPATTN
jgi:parvulin-like peptidyl-prolyl isomerase